MRDAGPARMMGCEHMRRPPMDLRHLVPIAALVIGRLPATCAGMPVQGATRIGGQVPYTAAIDWVRVAPRHPRTLFAGGYVGPHQAHGWLVRSDDAGASWIQLAHTYGADTPNEELGSGSLLLGANGTDLTMVPS